MKKVMTDPRMQAKDHFVAPRGNDAFAAAAPREVVEVECLDALYHEKFNESEAAAPVFAWLDCWVAGMRRGDG